MQEDAIMRVPRLTTVLTGPLLALEKHILSNQTAIEAWFRQQWQHTPAPVYGSVDLRNAGFKVAPVDMNLYPAGFNNLNPEFLPLAVQAVQATLTQRFPCCQRIVLVPENHTRNLFYWENVAVQMAIMQSAGFEVKIGSINPDVTTETLLELPSGKSVTIAPLERTGNRVHVGDYDPCLIWLNNDLSAGEPAILQSLDQVIMPRLDLGWHKRLKSVHFHHYQQVAEQFAEVIDIDPWLVNPLFQQCGKVDFMQREGEDCLAHNVEKLLSAIQKKYDAYEISESPFVVVKADAGTYGMSVMTVKSAEDILRLNRKQRTKMAASKGAHAVARVIMQEGVYSFEAVNDQQNVAEPVVYMMGEYVVGGFYRVHKNKGADESLNAPGMHFEPLEFAAPCSPNSSLDPEDCPNRFYTYGVVARLSMLAAAREQEAV